MMKFRVLGKPLAWTRKIPIRWVVLCCWLATAVTSSALQSGDFTYTVSSSNTVIITGYTGVGGDIDIPNIIEGRSVTGIGDNAFYNTSSLTSITIPDSVTFIGYRAFSGCSSLTSITIPDSVTSIGNYVFQNCTSLTSVTIRDGVTYIGSHMFSDCSSLTDITIPDSVTSIGYYAFSDCTSLTTVNLGSGIGSIRTVFNGCSSLIAFNVSTGNSAYSSLDGVLFNSDQTVLIRYPSAKSGSYAVPDGVTSIEWGAFQNSINLTSVTFPDSLTAIGNGAFSFCLGLTDITLPDSVTIFGTHMFVNCINLTNAVLGEGIASIGDSTFLYCIGLEEVTLPSGATNIGPSAFGFCSSLTEMALPDSVISIEEKAFVNCTGLIGITIPDSVTSIGDMAFHSCSSMTRLTLGNGVTSIGDQAFASCSGLKSLTLGNSITSIGGQAFEYCTGLTNVTLPNSLVSILDYDLYGGVFRGCSGLTDVTIPASLTSFDFSKEFRGCTSLTNIAVDAANPVYSSLGGVVFRNDQTQLLKVPEGKGGAYAVPAGVTSISQWAFYYCTSLTEVTIPASVTSVEAGAFYKCFNLTGFSVEAGNSELSSLDGVLFNKSQTELIMFPSGKTGSYAIPDGVLSAREYAFDSFNRVTSITVPASVSSLWFGVCRNLTEITVDAGNAVYSSLDGVLFNKKQTELIRYPGGKGGAYTVSSGVTSIGHHAFMYNDNLENITIPNGVSSIGASAFSVCTSLKGIQIPDGVTFIDYNTFYYCSSLTDIEIPGSVTSLGRSTFSSCTSLTNITVDLANTRYSSLGGVLFNQEQTRLIQFPTGRSGHYTVPDGVTYIEDGAFRTSDGLTSVTVPDSVTGFSYRAFSHCKSLKNIMLGEGIRSIGTGAFDNCPNLTGLYFSGSPPGYGHLGSDSIPGGPILYSPQVTSYYLPQHFWFGGAFHLGCPSALWTPSFEIEVNPDQLTDILVTAGETATQKIVISNTGEFPVNISFCPQDALPDWLAVEPRSGFLSAGADMEVVLTLNASGWIAGDYEALWLEICNDISSAPAATIPISMWAAPSAPIMVEEPPCTEGKSNTLFWSLEDGPVDYWVEAVAKEICSPGSNRMGKPDPSGWMSYRFRYHPDRRPQTSGWCQATNYQFNKLHLNTKYTYRVKASVMTDLGRIESAWSEWTESCQVPHLWARDERKVPDDWKRKRFGTIYNFRSLNDSDGDGLCDFDEYVAGAEPFDALSKFEITNCSTCPAGYFTLTWDAIPYRIYSVYWRKSMSEPFQLLSDHIRYPQNSYTDTVHTAENGGFYKVEVRLGE